LNRDAFPADVNSVVQYGSGIEGFMMYLMVGQFLPPGRICELLHEVMGLELSEGTLYNACAGCDTFLEPIEQQVKQDIQ
jgi:transposase